MPLIGFFFFGIISWFVGFWYTKGVIVQNKEAGNQNLILVPEWLFILCGRPKIKNAPSGVISLRGLFLQLMGLFIFTINFLHLNDFLKLSGSLILALVFSKLIEARKKWNPE